MFVHLHFTVDKCAKCDVHALCVRGRCKCMPGYIGTGYQCVKGKIKVKYNSMLTTCTIQYLLASLSYFNHPNSLQYVFLPFLQLTYLFLKTKSAYCIDGTV